MNRLALPCLLVLLIACDEKSAPSAPSAQATASASPTSEKSAPTASPGTLTVAQAQDAAKAAPDTVRDKKVKVTGVVAKVGKQTAGKSSVTHYVKLTPSRDETSPSLICDFHKVEPTGVEVGATVTVEGLGRLTKMEAKDGTIHDNLELRECTVLE